VTLTQNDPPAEATNWTSALMAKVVDISASSVQRIWRAHGLQPHRCRQFKLSNDPQFVATRATRSRPVGREALLREMATLKSENAALKNQLSAAKAYGVGLEEQLAVLQARMPATEPLDDRTRDKVQKVAELWRRGGTDGERASASISSLRWPIGLAVPCRSCSTSVQLKVQSAGPARRANSAHRGG
jgi:hypothetical protein